MKNVIVLFGGDSDEKEISKLSADSIINNIDTTKFDAQLLDLNNLNLKEVDKETVFFIAVHGFGGEDGQVQDLLSKNGYRFTGSDYESTKKCWDKVLSKQILIQNNINTPKFITIDKNEDLNLNDEFFSEITEYFVKPAMNGSSLGVSRVTNINDLESAVNDAKKFSDQFQARNIKKKYYVIVKGSIPKNKGEIITKENIKKKEVVSKSYFEVKNKNQDYSFLEVEILTGRKHQIRKQFSELGHPVIGDTRYGDKNSKNQLCLFSYYMEFEYLKKMKKYSLKLPKFMEDFVQRSFYSF